MTTREGKSDETIGCIQRNDRGFASLNLRGVAFEYKSESWFDDQGGRIYDNEGGFDDKRG